MAGIYKKKTKVTDPATGEKRAELSKKWWARYRDENDRLRRVSLSTSKTAAQKMLNDILEQVERRRSGLDDPVSEQSRRPFIDHLEDFEKHLKAKNNTPKHTRETIRRVKRMRKVKGWEFVHQITASDVENFLVDLREEQGRSIQTSNHYLRAIKTFVRWLGRSGRLSKDPLEGISMLNSAPDRRHDRRSLTIDEFARLYQVARSGPPAVGLSGPDRAMLYMLAAWTGLRRGEIGSLKLRSFDLQAKSPTVTVAASYSKHRREDVCYLHGELVEAFKAWLELRKPGPDDLLFPISEEAGGIDRRTSKMLRVDLGIAREIWISEAETEKDRQRREASDFLKYIDSRGRYADFHALRHTFVTNLARANVDPKTAQTLARHSNIQLTMDIYTHIDQKQQVAAIDSLPSLIQ